MNQARKFSISLMILLLIAVGSCDQKDSAEIVPTWVPTVSVTPVVTGAQTTKTPTSNVKPTMTLVPAWPRTEAKNEVVDLLENNSGCALPCFWGFAPGLTQKQELVSKLHKFDSLGGVSGVKFSEDEVDIRVFLSTRASDNPQEIIKHIRVVFEVYQDFPEGEYQVNPFYEREFYPSLPALLSEYGEPLNVYIMLDLGKEQGMEDLYLLFLDYSDRGWVAIYLMPAACDEESCRGCPARASVILDLWEPGDEEMASEYGFAGKTGNVFSLNEAAFMSVDEFYEIYKNPLSSQCLETPLTIFPGQ